MFADISMNDVTYIDRKKGQRRTRWLSSFGKAGENGKIFFSLSPEQPNDRPPKLDA